MNNNKIHPAPQSSFITGFLQFTILHSLLILPSGGKSLHTLIK